MQKHFFIFVPDVFPREFFHRAAEGILLKIFAVNILIDYLVGIQDRKPVRVQIHIVYCVVVAYQSPEQILLLLTFIAAY